MFRLRVLASLYEAMIHCHFQADVLAVDAERDALLYFWIGGVVVHGFEGYLASLEMLRSFWRSSV